VLPFKTRERGHESGTDRVESKPKKTTKQNSQWKNIKAWNWKNKLIKK